MEEKILSRLAPSFLPATGVLEMTYNCNHQCLFCSCPWEAKKNGFTKRKELSTPEWKNIIKTLCDNGVSNLAFTGGEPLMKPDIFDLIGFAGSCTTEHIETVDGSLKSTFAPPKLYLISNGKLVDEKVFEICAKHNVHLSMSLPGLTTLKYHTGGKGDPDIILDKFRKAKEYGLSTTVNVTVTRKNIHELYETIANGLIAGADSLLMNRFLPGGRGIKYTKELLLSMDQTNEMLDIAEEVLTTSNRIGSVGTELPKCILKRTDYKQLSVGTQCSAAIDFFVIGPSGYVRTCNHSPVELNNFTEWEHLKNHPYWKRFVMKQYHPEMCHGCGMLFDCDGGCREAAHIFGGKVDSPDPLLTGENANLIPKKN
jgi:radical SAM protein with 4Fe4S-binding SPASM domain